MLDAILTNVKQPQVDPAASTASPNLVGWLIYGAVRLAALVFSRFLLLTVLICLLLPLLLITASFANADIASWLSFTVWIVVLWPWMLTGRDHFTEADFDILIGGWSVLIVIVTFVLARFFPRFKLPIKNILLAATILYTAAAISVLAGSAVHAQDKIAFLSLVGLAYSGFLFAVLLLVGFDYVADAVKPKASKPSIFQ